MSQQNNSSPTRTASTPSALTTSLAVSSDAGVRRQTEFLAATFGDRSKFGALRQILGSQSSPEPERQHAFRVLSRARDDENMGVFIALLAEDNDEKGKKLSFILQEIGREINTTGAKAYDSTIQKCVVMMKDELEKAKEQVLNAL